MTQFKYKDGTVAMVGDKVKLLSAWEKYSQFSVDDVGVVRQLGNIPAHIDPSQSAEVYVELTESESNDDLLGLTQVGGLDEVVFISRGSESGTPLPQADKEAAERTTEETNKLVFEKLAEVEREAERRIKGVRIGRQILEALLAVDPNADAMAFIAEQNARHGR